MNIALAECPCCEYESPFEVRAIFPGLREIDAIFCCEEFREGFTEWINQLSPEEWRRTWRDYFKAWSADARGIMERSGLEVRNVIHAGPCDEFALDFNLTVKLLDRPGDQARAKEFINKYHRHNPAPPGWRFGLGCWNGKDLIAVAWVGRPIARAINQRTILEVNRLCVRTDIKKGLEWNACSQLYGASAREAAARGFEKIITYTLASEEGTSLKAAGWTKEHTTPDGQTWDRLSRPRRQQAPTCSKVRWGKRLILCRRPRHIGTPQVEPVERRKTISYQLSLF
jgi:hypothetical protein